MVSQKHVFLPFFLKTTQIFFSGFRKKHLFITTGIEKQCTLKPGALLLNAGCNEQVISPKP